MQKVMGKYAADPGLLKEHHEAMVDSLGVMDARHIENCGVGNDRESQQGNDPETG